MTVHYRRPSHLIKQAIYQFVCPSVSQSDRQKDNWTVSERLSQSINHPKPYQGSVQSLSIVDSIIFKTLICTSMGTLIAWLWEDHICTQGCPYVLTEGQSFSRPVRPNSVKNHFIIRPLWWKFCLKLSIAPLHNVRQVDEGQRQNVWHNRSLSFTSSLRNQTRNGSQFIEWQDSLPHFRSSLDLLSTQLQFKLTGNFE